MYLPRAFAENDLRALDALMERNDFVTVITVRDAMPVTSHLPVLYQRDHEHVELRGHWARPNPQSRHDGHALVIAHGPDAYVSPSWYPDKEQAARVPTWNYAVANLEGKLTIFDDEASLATIVQDLSRRHEARAGSDWRFDPEREDHRSQLRGIVGFRMAVDRVTLKFKLNQNHPLANRAAVAAQLASQQSQSSRDVAALMQERLGNDIIGD